LTTETFQRRDGSSGFSLLINSIRVDKAFGDKSNRQNQPEQPHEPHPNVVPFEGTPGLSNDEIDEAF
jgi:hypothetical protein